MSHVERMPPLDPAAMNEAQRKSAQALTAGPRGGVKGPFIALLRSPELMDRLQQVGEYLRFRSSLEPRISEFLMLVVSRAWTQQFEWSVHAPLALKAGEVVYLGEYWVAVSCALNTKSEFRDQEARDMALLKQKNPAFANVKISKRIAAFTGYAVSSDKKQEEDEQNGQQA